MNIPDDICFSVMEWLETRTILLNCLPISKQWYNVGTRRNKFKLLIEKEETLKLFHNSTFKTHPNLLELTIQIPASPIGNDGAKQLRFLRQLVSLSLPRNKIGDKGLLFISTLINLRYLDIKWNGFTDEGIKFISKMEQLTSLNISYNGIENQGIRHISRMKQLKILNVDIIFKSTI